MLWWRCERYEWHPQPTVYQVELVSATTRQFPRPENISPTIEPVPEKVNNTELIEEEPEPEETVAETTPKNDARNKSAKPAPASVHDQKLATPHAEGVESGEVTEPQFKIDTKDFPFAYYINLLRFRVKENWRPPPASPAQAGLPKREAIVSFKIGRNGKFSDIALEKASGHFLFDQAARRAVHYASPMPPLPNDFYENYLAVHIQFEGL